MARKNRSPEENERRAKIRELLQASNISSMNDIQNLFKETIAEFMENGLDGELDDELGYSKYDYKNKDTDNSRNGHSSKTLRTSFGDVKVAVPRDRNGEFEPQLLKKNHTSISQNIEEKILPMYAKGMTTSDIETGGRAQGCHCGGLQEGQWKSEYQAGSRQTRGLPQQGAVPWRRFQGTLGSD
ncbi:putative transposase for insertion sequence element [Oscillibacter valericigenes Sjm18-20]|nr:putative transposase for insertion sequence element [Oscillibacter valericigenes Sjm18-20]